MVFRAQDVRAADDPIPIIFLFGVPMQSHAHADDSEKFKIETGSRISIWRPMIEISGCNLVWR